MNIIPLNLDAINGEHTIEILTDGDYRGVYVGRGGDIKQMQLKFSHPNPGVNSRIHLKAVLFDDAKLNLEALLKIPKGAHLTDSYLKIDCLVIGDAARARAVPSLEIEEDEVKAGHGATVGRLDAEQLHYLNSRGLLPEVAKRLMIEAFLGEDIKIVTKI